MQTFKFGSIPFTFQADSLADAIAQIVAALQAGVPQDDTTCFFLDQAMRITNVNTDGVQDSRVTPSVVNGVLQPSADAVGTNTVVNTIL